MTDTIQAEKIEAPWPCDCGGKLVHLYRCRPSMFPELREYDEENSIERHVFACPRCRERWIWNNWVKGNPYEDTQPVDSAAAAVDDDF